jgi:nucleolar protein 9
MKSVFETDVSSPSSPVVPEDFKEMSLKLVYAARESLTGNEIRALAADNVGSPVLHVFLEVEASLGQSDIPDSLMDRVLTGMIASIRKHRSYTLAKPHRFFTENDELPKPSDFILTLLRDTTASHLLESVVVHASAPTFAVLWNFYFKGKLARLAMHPVANFVLAKAVTRLESSELSESWNEMRDIWAKVISE